MVYSGKKRFFVELIELKVSSVRVFWSIEVKGNCSCRHEAHCQLPLYSWKFFFALVRLLHLTWILELQLEQGIPGLFFLV